MAVVGFTAGLASAQLSGAFQQTIDPAYLGRTGSIVSLSDEALMPVAMTGFGALISLVGVGPSCLVVGGAFAVLMVWSAARLRSPAPGSDRPGRAICAE
jgi:arginine exporter protein ArgO